MAIKRVITRKLAKDKTLANLLRKIDESKALGKPTTADTAEFRRIKNA